MILTRAQIWFSDQRKTSLKIVKLHFEVLWFQCQFVRKPWIMSAKSKALPSLKRHRWKARCMRTETLTFYSFLRPSRAPESLWQCKYSQTTSIWCGLRLLWRGGEWRGRGAFPQEAAGCLLGSCCRMMEMQRWHRPPPSYKQAGTRLRVLVVNLASFLAYIHHTVGCWRTRRTIRTEQLQMLHFTLLSFKWEIISFRCHSWSKLSLKYILDCW